MRWDSARIKSGTPHNYQAGVQAGTIGVAGEMYQDGMNLYVCIANNSSTGTNWRSVSLVGGAVMVDAVSYYQ